MIHILVLNHHRNIKQHVLHDGILHKLHDLILVIFPLSIDMEEIRHFLLWCLLYLCKKKKDSCTKKKKKRETNVTNGGTGTFMMCSKFTGTGLISSTCLHLLHHSVPAEKKKNAAYKKKKLMLLMVGKESNFYDVFESDRPSHYLFYTLHLLPQCPCSQKNIPKKTKDMSRMKHCIFMSWLVQFTFFSAPLHLLPHSVLAVGEKTSSSEKKASHMGFDRSHCNWNPKCCTLYGDSGYCRLFKK